MRIGREHRQRIGRCHELSAPDDQIAVAVAIRCGAEIGRILRHHEIVEVLGIDEIGVGMVAAEIRKRRPVDHRPRRCLQHIFEDRLRIRAGDRMHRIEAHAEAGAKHLADGIEIEQRLHQPPIVGDRIDDLDRHLVQLLDAELR